MANAYLGGHQVWNLWRGAGTADYATGELDRANKEKDVIGRLDEISAHLQSSASLDYQTEKHRSRLIKAK
jgi:hypothetical protein